VTLDLDAYLERIGYRGPVEPTRVVLDELHLGHVTRIPFENLDILLGLPIRLDLESLQRKLVQARRGGYCFEHNTLFAAALEQIGFGVTRLAARVRFGTRGVTARTHMTLRVEADGEARLADVGFGGGSILRSMPIEPGRDVDQSGWGFRLVDDGDYRVLQARRPGGWVDLYAFTFEPQHAVDYELANHYTSTHPSSPFTRTLTAQLSAPDRSLILRGRKMIEETPLGESVSEVGEDELLGVLAARFTLVLPPGTRFDVPRAVPPVPSASRAITPDA
jgi:N-hydroxyarylamine O-acetyltransferase